MSNEELVVRVKQGDPTGSLMATLWRQNLGFVETIARKYSGMAEVEDLQQEAYLGLCRAVDHWDPEMGVKFLSYAGYWIQQAMARYIERDRGFSSRIQSEIRKLEKITSNYEKEFGRRPSDAEICDIMGVSKDKLDEIKKAENGQNTASLDVSVSSENGDSTLGDLVADDSDLEADVLSQIQNVQLAETLWPLVDQLPNDQREVLHRRYQGSETLQQVGDHIGKNLSQVRTIERKALKEMRKSKNRKKLEPFLDDRIFSEALKGNGIGRFSRSWESSTERVAIQLAGGGNDGCKGRNEN